MLPVELSNEGRGTGPVSVEGCIRRRRDFSKLLSFFTLEVTSIVEMEVKEVKEANVSSFSSDSISIESSDASKASITSSNPLSIQLKCANWSSPRNVSTGVKVRATGRWDTTENATNVNIVNTTNVVVSGTDVATATSRRLLVDEDSLVAIAEGGILPTLISKANDKAFELASEHVSWRSRAGATCQCSEILCPRSHGDSHRWKERSQLLQQMKYAKRALPDPDQDFSHKEPLASKAKHNLVFASWIMETFPRDVVEKGVVDIAGGRGLIALELALEHGIHPVTLIEPKQVRLNSTYRRRLKRWRCRNDDPNLLPVTAGGSNPVFEEDESDSNIEDNRNSEINSNTICNTEGSSSSSSSGGDGAGSNTVNNNFDNNVKNNIDNSLECIKQYAVEFHGLNEASEDVRSALENCGLIVAMHPDAATGAVIETAIQLNKPFAIVPCCVFSHMFPDRLTSMNTVVSTYEELLDYLQMRVGDKAKRVSLPFEGRNVVIYFNGNS